MKSKTVKATKPNIRTKHKSSAADLKDRAHRPQMAGDPIPRTKKKTGNA